MRTDERDRPKDNVSWSAFAQQHVDSITVVFTTLALSLALYIHLGVAFPLIYTEGDAEIVARLSSYTPIREASTGTPLKGRLLLHQVPHALPPQPQVAAAVLLHQSETVIRYQLAARRQLPLLGRQIPRFIPFYLLRLGCDAPARA
jgi:hypothetical protein